jgi:hypothetical protein
MVFLKIFIKKKSRILAVFRVSTISSYVRLAGSSSEKFAIPRSQSNGQKNKLAGLSRAR